jgi:hypothetical protein
LRYDTDQKKASFFQDLVRQVGSTPGVRGVAVAWYLPMMGFAGTPVQDASKPPLKLSERPIAAIIAVTPEYFSTVKIPFRRGGDLQNMTRQSGRRVAIYQRDFGAPLPAGVGGHTACPRVHIYYS